MSLKSIELQVAIPRTFDAGKLAEQKNQQALLNHQQTAVQVEEQTRKQRNSVMDSAEPEKTHNNEQTSDNCQPQDQEETMKENQKKELYASHPYKGGFVDYSG